MNRSKSKLTHSFYIKFYPGIKSSIGCEKATLILGQLEYWFEKYKNGFYKFVEPCNHPLYREGDSWSEELGFSRKIFAKAFNFVGVRYKSKSAFLKASDRFKGKLYASYHDRKTNRTYFIRNHDFATQFLNGLFNRKSSSTHLNQETENPKKTQSTEISASSPSSHFQGRSWNGQKSRSYGGTIGGKENTSIQRNTPSLETDMPKDPQPPSEAPQKELTEEMIKIWQEEIGELGVSYLSNGLLYRLQHSLKNCFEQSLDLWKTYCRMISSSKFLMGEAQNKFFKKAWITWAIKEEVIERIKGGAFNLGDRQTNEDKKIQEINNELKNIEDNKKDVEEKINIIQSLLDNERKAKIKEKTKAISEEEIEILKLDFIKFLEFENNSLTQEFRRSGWQGTFVEAYFKSFVEEKISSQLFSNSLKDEADKVIKTSGLLDILENFNNEIYAINIKKREIFKDSNDQNNTARAAF